MRKYVLSMVLLVMLGSLAIVMAQGKGKLKPIKDPMGDMQRNSVMSVEAIADGVVIRISSSDPDTVKLLQDEWGRRADAWNTAYRHNQRKKNSPKKSELSEREKAGGKRPAEKKQKK